MQAHKLSRQGPVMPLQTQEAKTGGLVLGHMYYSRQQSENVEQRRTNSQFLHQKIMVLKG